MLESAVAPIITSHTTPIGADLQVTWANAFSSTNTGALGASFDEPGGDTPGSLAVDANERKAFLGLLSSRGNLLGLLVS